MKDIDLKVKKIIQEHKNLEHKMASPEVTSDPAMMEKLGREYRQVEKQLPVLNEYLSVFEGYKEAKDIVNRGKDEELVELAQEELEEYSKRLPELEEEITRILVPSDPNDLKNAMVEIRAGTGGTEAGIFAADLYRMYTRYCELKNWKIEILSSSFGDLGAVKEVIFLVNGDGSYGLLKYESGVHRVQRVPQTESQGRIHTSAASVAVFPEADDVEIEINPEDLRIDVFRSSGPGGQSVNTTDSAVRITHIPTGMVVSCQDEKSQHKNKAKALKVLKSRLFDKMMSELSAGETAARRNMIGSGDRSVKIRTYNYPQARVTDHRINLTLYKLDEIVNGNIDELVDALILADIDERLKHLEQE